YADGVKKLVLPGL
nr:hypothetical protein [Tanacetum cinerariifolium]